MEWQDIKLMAFNGTTLTLSMTQMEIALKIISTLAKKWSNFMDEQGHTGGVWRWWPGAGAPNSFEGDFLMNISSGSTHNIGCSFN